MHVRMPYALIKELTYLYKTVSKRPTCRHSMHKVAYTSKSNDG